MAANEDQGLCVVKEQSVGILRVIDKGLLASSSFQLYMYFSVVRFVVLVGDKIY